MPLLDGLAADLQQTSILEVNYGNEQIVFLKGSAGSPDVLIAGSMWPTTSQESGGDDGVINFDADGIRLWSMSQAQD